MDLTELLFRLLTDPVFLGVAGTVLLVLVIVTFVVARRLFRRARAVVTSNAHLIDRAKTELKARSLPDGPQKEAFELRRGLGAAVAETDRVLAAAAGHALVTATVADQHHELNRLAASLDVHLRDLARDPDPYRVGAALPDARAWTAQLCDIAAELRAGVRASTTVTTDADVKALGQASSDGSAALRAGLDFLQARVRDYRTGR